MPRLPKQLIWSVLLWLVVGFDAWANTDAISITISPEHPITQNNIVVVISGLKENLEGITNANVVEVIHEIEGNIINVRINLYGGASFGTPLPKFDSYTVKVGTLPAGSYIVELTKSKTLPGGAALGDPEFIKQTQPFEVINNIHSIPTMSELSKLLLLALTGAIGLVYLKRNRYLNGRTN